MTSCPECAQGKPQNCTGWALDEADREVECSGRPVEDHPLPLPVLTVVIGYVPAVSDYCREHDLNPRSPDVLTITHPSAMNRLFGRRCRIEVVAVHGAYIGWTPDDLDRWQRTLDIVQSRST